VYLVEEYPLFMLVILISLFVLLLIQYYFAFGFFLRLVQFQNTPTTNHQPFVSVLVVAHNECDQLVQLVPSLLKQSYPDFEIIIVLDRCTDDSESYLKSLNSSTIKVYHLSDPQFIHPKKAGVKLGIQHAKANLILLTDADCSMKSDLWMASMVGTFSEDIDMVVGYSPYKTKPGFLNAVIQYETLHTALQYLSFAIAGKGYMSVGRNWAYRKQRFAEIGFGPMESHVGGDDDLLFQRMRKGKNYAVCLNEESFVESSPPTTWRWWFNQKKRHLSAGKRYDKVTNWQLMLYQFSWLFYLPMVFFMLKFNFLYGILFFIARVLVFATIFHILARRLKNKLYWLTIIQLDIFYNICYFILALSVLLSKKVQWK
jgi:glycosyltransferase involved in cell wall biosynthesis